MIYGVPFGVTALESVSEGVYQVEVMGNRQIVPAEKIDQIVFDAYFSSPLARTSAPLPGLSADSLRMVILKSAERGDISNSLAALRKFVLQSDVKSSDSAALMEELVNLPGREVIHQFLSSRDSLIIPTLAIAPVLLRLLPEDAQFLRSSASDLMVRVLAAVRRRLVAEELATVLAEPSKAEQPSSTLDAYALVYGSGDEGCLDASLLRDEVAFIWQATKAGNMSALPLVPLLLQQSESVLLPGDRDVMISFVMKLVGELERGKHEDAAIKLVTSIPFNRRSPDVHSALVRLLSALNPSEQSVLLNETVRAKIFNYGIEDPVVRDKGVEAIERLVSFFVERGDFEVAEGLMRDAVQALGTWTPLMVEQTIAVVSGLMEKGAAEAARQSLGLIQGRVSLRNYPQYLWLRLRLGASSSHLLVLLIYLLLVITVYLYVRRLHSIRYQAIDKVYSDEGGDPERPRFVQYWHQSSPLLAEYLRNLEILGLRPGSTPSQIKQNYRAAVKRLRSALDKGRDLEATEELMKIQAAYKRIQEIESDPIFAGLLRDAGIESGVRPNRDD